MTKTKWRIRHEPEKTHGAYITLPDGSTVSRTYTESSHYVIEQWQGFIVGWTRRSGGNRFKSRERALEALDNHLETLYS